MKQLTVFDMLMFCFSSGFPQVKPFSFEGTKRKYLIYFPASYHANSTTDFPLVFNFHGGGMTVAEQMLYTKMNETAEKHGFVVVYPAGIKEDWNVGFGTSYRYGINDVGFINALVDSLTKEHRIDRQTIYAVGLSRGGFFCHRLAAELPDAFAAIASVGGTLPDSMRYYHKS
jgi:polyhydroxybutyrate depolymerase